MLKIKPTGKVFETPSGGWLLYYNKSCTLSQELGSFQCYHVDTGGVFTGGVLFMFYFKFTVHGLHSGVLYRAEITVHRLNQVFVGTKTHSPTDSRFCFSSFLIRGRPGFIFRGDVGVFCAAGWMKWANTSVCFSRYSNLLVRSVCCITQEERSRHSCYQTPVVNQRVKKIIHLPLSPHNLEQNL